MNNKKIYTSYFANIRNIPSSIKPVAISLFVPNFYNGTRATELAPSKEILDKYKSGNINEEEFKILYLDLLLENSNSLDKWVKYFENNEVVLVCYEGKNKFCHRHILAELLTSLGFSVFEF